MKKMCKECGQKALPNGNNVANYAARKLGYCRDCYDFKFPMKPARGRSIPPRSDYVPDFVSEDVFDPDSPWEWYEYFFPERDR